MRQALLRTGTCVGVGVWRVCVLALVFAWCCRPPHIGQPSCMVCQARSVLVMCTAHFTRIDTHLEHEVRVNAKFLMYTGIVRADTASP